MVFKPLEERAYLKYLKIAGWALTKGSIDYKLYDSNGAFVCAIKICHGKHTKREVAPKSVQRTEQEFKERGLAWPPKKK